jgi:hypothetical protein
VIVAPTTAVTTMQTGTRPASMQQIAATATTGNSSTTVNISQAARDRLATQTFDTNHGATEINLDTYFTPPGSQGVDIDTVPLLMPTQQNIAALAKDVSAKMPGFLSAHGIPSAPASITYDNMGQIQLPADYPYADAFKQALADQPSMERELRTTAALTSSMVEMNKSMPFQQEYLAANSRAEADAVVAKYSYLFSNNQHADLIALNFAANGALSLTHDGQPLALA